MISIHALREEGDGRKTSWCFGIKKFLSTPSARRATDHDLVVEDLHCISIHALREEGDYCHRKAGRPEGDFYPRPPRGGRPSSLATMRKSWANFYPRPPRGGRRLTYQPRGGQSLFLSTPSARRATRHLRRQEAVLRNFYPRPPRGGRRAVHRSDHGQQPISIHALREEGDNPCGRTMQAPTIFLSTPSARRATHSCFVTIRSNDISIHALREEGD